jgi:uncharacterized membrane protein YdjX (TVP38/TMEM64 family)
MKALGRFAPLAVILVALVALYLSPARHLITLDSLRSHQLALQSLVAQHPMEALSLYMAAYATCCALCLPFNLVITLAGGLMFGPWVATPATVVAGGIGSLGAYFAARTAFAGPLLRLAERRGGALHKVVDGFGKNAFSYVLSLRLIPVFPFWVVSVAAGVVSPPIWSFVSATMLGIIPATFIYTGLGAGFGKAFASGQPVSLSVIFAPHVILPLLGLAVLSLAPVALARFRKAP